LHLHQEGIPFRVAVSELHRSPLVDELIAKGLSVYRQPRLPGDRWLLTKRCLLLWLETQLQQGDWMFCVCPPYPAVYLSLVRSAHRRRAKVAVSWFLAPEFWPPIPEVMGTSGDAFCQAVAETDAVISVSQCTAYQFREVYGYPGKVHVVPYHNLLFFQNPLPLPTAPPWKIGFMGRLDMEQKSLDTLLQAIGLLLQVRQDIQLHLYGGGADEAKLTALAASLDIQSHVVFHGIYDHRRDLSAILLNCHFFVHPSRWEGGPCFSLLELMQAGRYCVAARVGGIPDLYAGLPNIGLLVPCGDATALSQALLATIANLAMGTIDGDKIRARYFDGFDMASAHRAWAAVML